MNVDLRAMRQFVAVAEELHFGRAAARLNMAQPPLSQAIKRLEEGLGFSLFERTRRKVALTPAGRVFLEEARRALQQADEAVRLARRAASEELAQLSVTFVSAALYRVLPDVLRRFRAAWPGTEIKLDERPTDLQVADLRSGATDIGFVHPPVRDGYDLEIETVHTDRLVVALPRTSSLVAKEQLSLSELASESFVLFPHGQGPALHAHIMQACRRAGFLPQIAQEARQMHTILTLVAAGVGVSLVPAGAQTMHLDGVAFRPLEDVPTTLGWELAIAWRQRGATLALRRFLSTVRDVAAEHAAVSR